MHDMQNWLIASSLAIAQLCHNGFLLFTDSAIRNHDALNVLGSDLQDHPQRLRNCYNVLAAKINFSVQSRIVTHVSMDAKWRVRELTEQLKLVGARDVARILLPSQNPVAKPESSATPPHPNHNPIAKSDALADRPWHV